MKIYDVVIIGGGISGLMAAYGLRKNDNDLRIAIIDKGKQLEKRNCPASNELSCVKCKSCSITSGFAGAGAFSDGKYNIGTAYGGTLKDELGEDKAMEYINKVETILETFTPKDVDIFTYDTDEKLKTKCLQNNLQLLDMKVKHFGTDNNFLIMNNLIKWLDNHYIDLIAETEITDISEGYMYSINNTGKLYKYALSAISSNPENDVFIANKVIIATGRNGADFIEKICNKFDIPMVSNAVDIGVRVEMKDAIWKEFSSKIYEPKILYKTKTFEDNCRMFCFNQGGKVSAENNEGIITANGHSFADIDKKTDNCNFAILSSIKFTEPFDKPTQYAKSYSQMANIIGNGNVIVQRFGDLIRGRRTNDKRLNQNTVQPTLKATAGDLSLVLPYRILNNIIETLYALDKVAPGTANDDTLLYGCESKYYSVQPKHNESFDIYCDMYLIGDGSGICRGLSQSGAMGLYVAEKIYEDEKGVL